MKKDLLSSYQVTSMLAKAKIFIESLMKTKKSINKDLHFSAVVFNLLKPQIFLIYSKSWNVPLDFLFYKPSFCIIKDVHLYFKFK